MGTFAEKVSYLNETKLLIKDAIENKGVTVEDGTPFREYANKIASISASVDDIEPIVISGNARAACAGHLSAVAASLLGNKISTSNLTSVTDMFQYYTAPTIPFALNFDPSVSNPGVGSMLRVSKIHEVPKINFLKTITISSLFYGCYYLKEIPNNLFETCDLSILQNTYGVFCECYSLRKIAPEVLKELKGHATHSNNYMDRIYYSGFTNCYSLDEIRDLAVEGEETNPVSIGFYETFKNNYRLSNMTFEVNSDGSAKKVQWKGATIDFTTNVGYASASKITNILNYNSGITEDKEVKDAASYQALKNDPDWFSCNIAYSRYNHDSAVTTINSLPDVFDYLAEVGGTMTIKFRGAAGELTDGGAINTLTEEEIAVATAKGWTVTFA